jgi:predicted HTH domain antitoxin
MKIILELPEKPELKNLNVTQYLVSKMYQDGLLSAGQAAQLAEISKEEFLEQLGSF